MTPKKLAAGDTIDSRCTRCREITNHTIVAMVEDRVARVECKVCGSVHNHKATAAPKKAAVKPAKAPKSTTSKAAKSDPKAAERAEWESRCGAFEGTPIPYRMTEKFKEEDFLDHPTFGLGWVKKVSAADKILVLFRDGIKLLRCRN
ncbi:MAG: hypothetical protein JXB25_04220 [Deltaproteobacteria bacterium]|nr:hypothetical protein [Deltaproteobacteria bacterium]